MQLCRRNAVPTSLCMIQYDNTHNNMSTFLFMLHLILKLKNYNTLFISVNSKIKTTVVTIAEKSFTCLFFFFYIDIQTHVFIYTHAYTRVCTHCYAGPQLSVQHCGQNNTVINHFDTETLLHCLKAGAICSAQLSVAKVRGWEACRSATRKTPAQDKRGWTSPVQLLFSNP